MFMDLHILYCLYNISFFYFSIFLLINGWKVLTLTAFLLNVCLEYGFGFICN